MLAQQSAKRGNKAKQNYVLRRLEGDHREDKSTIDYKQEEERDNDEIVIIRSVSDDEMYSNGTMNESHLSNILFHVSEMIMEFSIGVEQLKFCATCKRCHLAAPMMQWRNEVIEIAVIFISFTMVNGPRLQARHYAFYGSNIW